MTKGIHEDGGTYTVPREWWLFAIGLQGHSHWSTRPLF